jgi:hypothetical protein
LITIKASRWPRDIVRSNTSEANAPEAALEHMKELRDALEKLLEELSHYDGNTKAPEAGEHPEASDHGEAGILHELAAHLEETKDNVGDILASHPVATAGAAFLLGVAVGRLSK